MEGSIIHISLGMVKAQRSHKKKKIWLHEKEQQKPMLSKERVYKLESMEHEKLVLNFCFQRRLLWINLGKTTI